MGNWDDLDNALKGVELSSEAGEWAVLAMACVACADGHIDEREIEKARQIVANAKVIKDALGAQVAEQLFMDAMGKLGSSPENPLDFFEADLVNLAKNIKEQTHRDHAFQTLLVIAKADQQIDSSEYKILLRLKEIVESQLLVPTPQFSV